MRLVVVDPVSSSTEYIPKALSRGMDVLVVLTSGIPEVFAAQVAALREAHPALEFLDFPTETPGPDFDGRFAVGSWDYVVCAGETGTAAADYIRELLGLVPRNAGPSGPRFDKFAAQQALRRAGLRHIRSELVSDRDQLVELADRAFPQVVKPTTSAGTDGVRVVVDNDELAAAVDLSLGGVNALGRRNEQLVVQEYIQGTEYVVDGFVHGDTWRAASICKYEKNLVNGSPIYNSLIWLERDAIPQVDRLEAYVLAMLNALGVRIGCFHAEFFRTDADWVMIEIGMRPHGGGHPRFTEMITGTSQIEMELDGATHGRHTGGPLPSLQRKGCVVFFSVDRAVVFDANPAERLAAVEGLVHSSVSVQAGQPANPPRTLFDTFGLGFVVLVAETDQELQRRAKQARTIFASCHSDTNRPEGPAQSSNLG